MRAVVMPAPRPALRDRLRHWARRLSAPLMGVGFGVVLVGLMSLQFFPLLREVPVLLLGAGLFAGGMWASGTRLGEWFF